MELLTRQSAANAVYSKWMQQYPDDKNGIGKKLKNLGKTPKPDDVDHIIGNKSWTATPGCSECGRNNVDVVMVGEPLNYESLTAFLCKECIAKSLACIV